MIRQGLLSPNGVTFGELLNRSVDEADGEAVARRKWPPSTQRALFASLEASAPRCMGQRLWKLSLRNTARDRYYSDSAAVTWLQTLFFLTDSALGQRSDSGPQGRSQETVHAD